MSSRVNGDGASCPSAGATPGIRRRRAQQARRARRFVRLVFEPLGSWHPQVIEVVVPRGFPDVIKTDLSFDNPPPIHLPPQRRAYQPSRRRPVVEKSPFPPAAKPQISWVSFHQRVELAPPVRPHLHGHGRIDSARPPPPRSPPG
jgi:hypothetical protein